MKSILLVVEVRKEAILSVPYPLHFIAGAAAASLGGLVSLAKAIGEGEIEYPAVAPENEVFGGPVELGKSFHGIGIKISRALNLSVPFFFQHGPGNTEGYLAGGIQHFLQVVAGPAGIKARDLAGIHFQETELVADIDIKLVDVGAEVHIAIVSFQVFVIVHRLCGERPPFERRHIEHNRDPDGMRPPLPLRIIQDAFAVSVRKSWEK